MEFLTTLRRKLSADRVSGLAAEVAFWAVLSVVPATIVLTSFIGLVGSAFGGDVGERVEQQFINVVDGSTPGGSDGLAGSVSDLFEQSRPGLFSVALVVTVWAASRAAASVVGALDVINATGRSRSWLARRLLGLGLAVGTLLLVTGVLVAFAFGSEFVVGVWSLLAWCIVAVLWTTAIYVLVSADRRSWRRHLPGAGVAVVLALLFTVGFRIYLGIQAGNAILFSLGGVLVALLWMYLVAVGLLVGAGVNAVGIPYAGRHDHDRSGSARP